MPSTYVVHLLYLGLAAICFFLAVQRRPSWNRRTLEFGHVLSISMALCGGRADVFPYSQILVPMIFGLSLHTSSILFVEQYIMEPIPLHLFERVKMVYRILGDVRRHELVKGDTTSPITESCEPYSRGRFAVLRCARLLGFWIGFRLSTKLFLTTILKFKINIEDFAPSKQGIIPPSSTGGLLLRSIMSVNWIWATYASLSATHDILAILFVCILRWDCPGDWPSLFGSVIEAYSLRRFWGVFWHRLHVAPFEAYMPCTLVNYMVRYTSSQYKLTTTSNLGSKSFRAFWMFFLSAICHAAVSWINKGKGSCSKEMRFFMSNYFICVVEMVMSQAVRKCGFPLPKIGIRICGYLWVFTVFFCIAPAWQYPEIYDLK